MLPGWDSIEEVSRWSHLFSILGFIALFFTVLFPILAYVYSQRKDTLITIANSQAEKKHAEDIADVARRYDEQLAEAAKEHRGEIAEANRRVNASELRVKELEEKAAPRKLDEDHKKQISAFLAKNPNGAFTIKADVTSFDARLYAEQIAELFRSRGWTVKVDDAMFTGAVVSGLWITVKDGKKAPPSAGILQNAFAAAGMSVRGQVNPELSTLDEVWLSVGRK